MTIGLGSCKDLTVWIWTKVLRARRREVVLGYKRIFQSIVKMGSEKVAFRFNLCVSSKLAWIRESLDRQPFIIYSLLYRFVYQTACESIRGCFAQRVVRH